MTRDEIIRRNPILDYCEARGWQMRRAGAEFTCLCPIHQERTPSFYINPVEEIFHCFGCDAGGSVIDLHARLNNLTIDEAKADLGGDDRDRHEFQDNARRANDHADQEKARLRQTWPTFDVPTKQEIRIIAELRGLSEEGVTLAAQAGLLFCAESREGPRAWIVTDSRRVNAQARRLDGGNWASIGNRKAHTLPGSVAKWPVGLREAQQYGAIALVEGGPDLLAAYHLIWIASQETRVAPVAMLGASNNIPAQALPLFAGKRVRVFADRDAEGFAAEKRWWEQLRKVDARVDGYSFADLTTSDGAPVVDLNDFCHVAVDEWEREWPEFDRAFVL